MYRDKEFHVTLNASLHYPEKLENKNVTDFNRIQYRLLLGTLSLVIYTNVFIYFFIVHFNFITRYASFMLLVKQ